MSRLHRGRLGAAAGTAAAVVLSSPFIGEIRADIRAAFPAQFQTIVSASLGAAIVIALGIAGRTIRQHRARRLAGVAASIAGAALYARVVATGNLEVDVVEHVHFIEYGLLAWLFYRAWRPLDNGLTLAWPFLAGTLVGIIDESVQWFIPVRVGEAHDIFLNAVAVACGLVFAASVDPPARLDIPVQRRTLRPLAHAVSLVITAFALFFQAVHLGHQVYDPTIGMFRSRYTAANLIATSADRARRWRSDPPLLLRRLSREDQYLSEGLWHVQERNRAWGAGDPFTAWRENRILETFFPPVLDTPSYLSSAPARWPQEQRDQTASRVGGDPGIYISRAAPYPIYAWSPVAFWSAVGVLVAAVLTAC